MGKSRNTVKKRLFICFCLSCFTLLFILSSLLTLNLSASPRQFLYRFFPLSLSRSFSLPGNWARIYGGRGSNWTAVQSPIRELGCWGLNLGQQKQQFSSFSPPALSALPCSLSPSLLLASIWPPYAVSISVWTATGVFLRSLDLFVSGLEEGCWLPQQLKLLSPLSRVLGLYERWPLAHFLSVCRLPLFWAHASSFSDSPPVCVMLYVPCTEGYFIL